MKDMENTLPFAVGMSIVKPPTFIVGRRPSGISAVVLRRGGRLVEVKVAKLINEGQRIVLRASIKKRLADQKTKPTKRKAEKKR